MSEDLTIVMKSLGMYFCNWLGVSVDDYNDLCAIDMEFRNASEVTLTRFLKYAFEQQFGEGAFGL